MHLFTTKSLSLYVFGPNNGSGVRKAHQSSTISEIRPPLSVRIRESVTGSIFNGEFYLN
jgi:hypothetical protein